MHPFAAIIPTLNEETLISETIRSVRKAGIDRIIVSDGGSSDRTIELARALGAEMVAGGASRGGQINLALARIEDETIVIVVHADTLLPTGACGAIREAIHRGSRFGGFELSFQETSLRLRLAAFLINFRSRILREPWGDQAQWFQRETARGAGDYPDIPILEDYEFARRMRKSVRTEILADPVRTSGRRFLRKGVLATAFVNWTIITRYHLGVHPRELAAIYRGESDRATSAQPEQTTLTP